MSRRAPVAALGEPGPAVVPARRALVHRPLQARRALHPRRLRPLRRARRGGHLHRRLPVAEALPDQVRVV